MFVGQIAGVGRAVVGRPNGLGRYTVMFVSQTARIGRQVC